MSLFTPDFGADFSWRISNHETRPSASMGTAVAASQNTMGPWTQLIAGSLVSYDVYGIYVGVNANTRSASARDTIVDIGASTSDGWGVIIPALLGSCAPTMAVGTGHEYYFPLYVRAGTPIGARCSINSTLLGNAYVYVTLYGQPRRPEAVRAGAYAYAIGVVPASSAGTPITSGTTSEGAWTLLGSAASPAWWWQCSMGCQDDTMNALVYTVDIGAGSPQRVIITDRLIMTHGTAETMSAPLYTHTCEYRVEAGVPIYARARCSGTPDSGLSVIAYAVGG